MTDQPPQRGTRAETAPPHALFQAHCRSLTHRDGVDLIALLYPTLSRSWAKRNYARMMRMTAANMAQYLANCVQIVRDADLISALMAEHEISREHAMQMIASADMAGRISRAGIRMDSLNPAISDPTAITAVARVLPLEVAA